MPSIKILEQDLTTGGGRISEVNIVYVPGFMSNATNANAAECAWPVEGVKADTQYAAKKRTPTLCSSVAEFEKYFGLKPAVFDSTPGSEKYDLSYIYAKELLSLGLPVLYESLNDVTDEPKEEDFKIAINDKDLPLFDRLSDLGNYQFKYVTSGGYPLYVPSSATNASDATFKKMAKLALDRGDCIALIDHGESVQDTAGKKLKLPEMYERICVDTKDMDGADCSAMFTPWINVDCVSHKPFGKDSNNHPNKNITFALPPSFAYLSAFAKSLKTNASWLAVAGATRGQVPNLNGVDPLSLTGEQLSNSVAESFQNRGDKSNKPVSINAITNIKPFGHRIWGNRTLKDNSLEGNLTATSFLNTRNMICDVKKVVYDACRKYTFEQNNDVLWLNFKSYVEPTLEKMKAGAGISGYKITKGDTAEKAKLVANIKLYPIYPVEDFEITVQMLDDEISVS